MTLEEQRGEMVKRWDEFERSITPPQELPIPEYSSFVKGLKQAYKGYSEYVDAVSDEIRQKEGKIIQEFITKIPHKYDVIEEVFGGAEADLKNTLKKSFVNAPLDEVLMDSILNRVSNSMKIHKYAMMSDRISRDFREELKDISDIATLIAKTENELSKARGGLAERMLQVNSLIAQSVVNQELSRIASLMETRKIYQEELTKSLYELPRAYHPYVSLRVPPPTFLEDVLEVGGGLLQGVGMALMKGGGK